MQGTGQSLEDAGEGQSRPEGGGHQDVDHHEHVERAFALFPGLMLAQLLTDDLARVNRLKDVQAHLLAHLVIQFDLA